MANSEGTDDTSIPGERMRNRSAAERVQQELNKRKKEDGKSLITEGPIFEGLVNRLLEMMRPDTPQEEAAARRQGRRIETRNFDELKLAAPTDPNARETVRDLTMTAEYWLRKIAAGNPEDVRLFVKNNLNLGRVPTEEDIEEYARSFTHGTKQDIEAKTIAQDLREIEDVNDLETEDADYKYALFLATNQKNGGALRLRQADVDLRAVRGEDVEAEKQKLAEDIREGALEVLLYDIGLNQAGDISTKAINYMQKLQKYAQAKGIGLEDPALYQNAPPWVGQVRRMLEIYSAREANDAQRDAQKGDPRLTPRRGPNGEVLPHGQDEEYDAQAEALSQAQGRLNTYENVPPQQLPEVLRQSGFSQEVVNNFDPSRNPQGFSREQLAVGARNLLMFNDIARKSAELTEEFKPIIGSRGQLLDLKDPAQSQMIREELIRKYGAERGSEVYYSVHSEIAKLSLPEIRQRFIEENMWKFVEEPNADWDDLKFGQVREVLHALHTVQTRDEREASGRTYTAQDSDWGQVTSDNLVRRRADAEARLNKGALDQQGFNREVSKIQDLLQEIAKSKHEYLEQLRKQKDDLFIEVIGRINLHNVARACRTQGPEQITQTVHTIEERQVQLLTRQIVGVSQALNALEESDGAYFRSHEQASATLRDEDSIVSAEVQAEEAKIVDKELDSRRRKIWAVRTKIKIIKDKEQTDFITSTLDTLEKGESSLKTRGTIIGDTTKAEGQARDRLIQSMGTGFDRLVTALYAEDAKLRTPATATRAFSLTQVARKVLQEQFSRVRDEDGVRVYDLRGVSLENVDEIASRVADMAQEANLAMNLAHKLYLMEGKGAVYESHQWKTQAYFEELDRYNTKRRSHGLVEVDTLPNYAEPTEIWFTETWIDPSTDREAKRTINIYEIEKAAQYIRRRKEYEKKYKAYFGVNPDGATRTEPKQDLQDQYNQRSQGDTDEAKAFRAKYPSLSEYLNYGENLPFFGLKDFFTVYPTLEEYVKGYETFTYNKNANDRGDATVASWEFDKEKFIEDKKFYNHYRSRQNARHIPQACDAAIHEFQDKNFERFNINNYLSEQDYLAVVAYDVKRTGRTVAGDRATRIAEGKKLIATKYPIGTSFGGKTETNIRRLYHYAGYSIKKSTHANNWTDQTWLSRTADLLVHNMGRTTGNLSIQEMADTWEENFNTRKGAWDERYSGGDKLRKELLSAGEQILHASNGMRLRPVEMLAAYLKAVDHVKGGYEQTICKFLLKKYLHYSMNMIKQDTKRHNYMSIYEADSHIRNALSQGLLNWPGYREVKSELMGWMSLGSSDWGSLLFDIAVVKSKINFTSGIIGFIVDLIKGGSQGVLVGR